MTQDTRPPTTTSFSWTAMVKRMLNEDPPPKEVVYEFSNGRKFTSTDHTESGIYDQSN